jgi:hypothetical protein
LTFPIAAFALADATLTEKIAVRAMSQTLSAQHR